MPSLEVGDELDAEQQEHEDQEPLDDSVEPRRGRVGRRIGRGDSSIRGADESYEGIGYRSDGGGDLLELQEADPGQLAGAPGAVFSDRPIGAGAADLDGEQVTGRIVAVFVVRLSLLVPPFLKLVVVWST